MVFTLKLFDTKLLRFSAEPKSSDPGYKIIWIDESKKNLLPMDLIPTEESLASWIRKRNIPKNRAFVDSFLAKNGLSANRPLGIITVSKGLSLNDSYWITEEGFEGTFESCNLYKNRFSRLLGDIAFTGYGSSVRSGFSSSPEFTTNGMLPKCWRRCDGKIQLYKGGTKGAGNTGFEPYSEFYAFQIAEALGVKAVPYGISKWKGELCSTCGLFTSEELSFVPAGRLVREGGFPAVLDFYKSLGKDFENSLYDMLVFDAVIKNTDRHCGNFGFLVQSRANKILSPAPLFDHGNSLYSLAGLDDFDSAQKLAFYDKALQPRVYDDFVEMAKRYATGDCRASLRKLLDFTFRKHPRYNLPEQRLKRIEAQVRKNAAEILD